MRLGTLGITLDGEYHPLARCTMELDGETRPGVFVRHQHGDTQTWHRIADVPDGVLEALGAGAAVNEPVE